MVTDIPVKDNTAIVYFHKKSDDTSLDKNLCNYNLLFQIHKNLIDNENKRYTSTRDFVYLDDNINTSLHQISGTKKYISIHNTNQKNLIEISGFIKKLKNLYAENTDKALIYIFDVIDDWSTINEINKFEKLFVKLINVSFNEDIYVSLLASTILIKDNPQRIKYFDFVYNELKQKYNENELQIILKGL